MSYSSVFSYRVERILLSPAKWHPFDFYLFIRSSLGRMGIDESPSFLMLLGLSVPKISSKRLSSTDFSSCELNTYLSLLIFSVITLIWRIFSLRIYLILSISYIYFAKVDSIFAFLWLKYSWVIFLVDKSSSKKDWWVYFCLLTAYILVSRVFYILFDSSLLAT